jgi:hypothetical protein
VRRVRVGRDVFCEMRTIDLRTWIIGTRHAGLVVRAVDCSVGNGDRVDDCVVVVLECYDRGCTWWMR